MKPNIPKYPNKHITKNGQLFSLVGGKWREITPRLNQKGMKIFFFRHKDGFATVKASRLVAKTYLGLRENQFVTYKDGNRTNAKVSNLVVLNKKELGELVGRKIKEGLRNYWKGVYSGEIQRKPRKPYKQRKLTARKIKTIRSLAGIKTWNSLAKKYKVHIRTICKIIGKETWKHVK